MQDQTPPEKKTGRLRGWLIKTGLVLPPKGKMYTEKQEDTDQQRKAKQDLVWHQLRPPRDV